MKIKLIEPNKLLRTTNCFVHNGKVCYDISEKTKSLTEYLSNLKTYLIVIYEPSDFEVINFNEYYDVDFINYESTSELTNMQLAESKNNLFKVIIKDYELSFVGLKNRIYYELYDDDLNLIPLFGDE